MSEIGNREFQIGSGLFVMVSASFSCMLLSRHFNSIHCFLISTSFQKIQLWESVMFQHDNFTQCVDVGWKILLIWTWEHDTRLHHCHCAIIIPTKLWMMMVMIIICPMLITVYQLCCNIKLRKSRTVCPVLWVQTIGKVVKVSNTPIAYDVWQSAMHKNFSSATYTLLAGSWI